MAYQSVFQRYELKYILTRDQRRLIEDAMEQYMAPDQYGRTTICNLYFDTENYQLIRHSIEKPAYKEKLRIRSYGRAVPESMVFVELKRKYDGVVYKRRVNLPERTAMDWLVAGRPLQETTQISREIDYFMAHYKTLRPRVFLSYERQAWYDKGGSGFRVTFDENILCRQEELSLCAASGGVHILPPDKVLMEIKCAGGIPMWLTQILSREKIYKTSFSKYGTMYQSVIYPNTKELIKNA